MGLNIEKWFRRVVDVPSLFWEIGAHRLSHQSRNVTHGGKAGINTHIWIWFRDRCFPNANSMTSLAVNRPCVPEGSGPLLVRSYFARGTQVQPRRSAGVPSLRTWHSFLCLIAGRPSGDACLKGSIFHLIRHPARTTCTRPFLCFRSGSQHTFRER